MIETCGNCKHSVKHWTPGKYVCMRASDSVDFVKGDQEACSDFDPLTCNGPSGICEAWGYALVLGIQSVSAERTCRNVAPGGTEAGTFDVGGVFRCSACGFAYRFSEMPYPFCPECGAKVAPC